MQEPESIVADHQTTEEPVITSVGTISVDEDIEDTLFDPESMPDDLDVIHRHSLIPISFLTMPNVQELAAKEPWRLKHVSGNKPLSIQELASKTSIISWNFISCIFHSANHIITIECLSISKNGVFISPCAQLGSKDGDFLTYSVICHY
ncbi:hypothetical protein Tco_0837512 [Tanacetum coccineum]